VSVISSSKECLHCFHSHTWKKHVKEIVTDYHGYWQGEFPKKEVEHEYKIEICCFCGAARGHLDVKHGPYSLDPTQEKITYLLKKNNGSTCFVCGVSSDEEMLVLGKCWTCQRDSMRYPVRDVYEIKCCRCGGYAGTTKYLINPNWKDLCSICFDFLKNVRT